MTAPTSGTTRERGHFEGNDAWLCIPKQQAEADLAKARALLAKLAERIAHYEGNEGSGSPCPAAMKIGARCNCGVGRIVEDARAFLAAHRAGEALSDPVPDRPMTYTGLGQGPEAGDSSSQRTGTPHGDGAGESQP